ncbi:MAG: hypothetical protein SF187_16850 [Deltaproteobacteria bacterium]|nr:hypothetical protein [Deltaproteobacteria bacterium]
MSENLIRVEIESLAPGGDAFGRQVGGAAEGRATFVPLAAPGELVTARLGRQKRDVAWATLEKVERESHLRAVPPCPVFGVCGGCQWQHVTIETQRAAKLAIVKRALRFENVTLSAPCAPFGYRERAKLVSVHRGPTRVLGFKKAQSHEVVDIERCPLLAEPLNTALAKLRSQALPVGEVALQLGAGGLVGVAGAGQPASTINLAGVDEPVLEISVGGFAQVSRAANNALVQAVLAQVGPQPGRVLELYAGAGNFTRFLVSRAAQVMASDGDGVAVQLGAKNVPQASWVAPDAVPLHDVFDTVVVDPPRAGLDALALDLARLARKTIVYVSCDPQTLGRDARLLAGFGFQLTHAEAFDLMPQTHHVEVVARFSAAGTG